MCSILSSSHCGNLKVFNFSVCVCVAQCILLFTKDFNENKQGIYGKDTNSYI